MANDLREVIGSGFLENTLDYTFTQDNSSLGKSCVVTLGQHSGVDVSEIDKDGIYTLNIAGNRDSYIVGETALQPYRQTIEFLSREITQIGYTCSTKAVRFMSMTVNENYDFYSYLRQSGAHINNLAYEPIIEIFKYNFFTFPVGISGGWLSWGSSSSILNELADRMGIRIECTLPSFRVRQFEIPLGSSYLAAIVSLVSIYDPVIHYDNGSDTLYIYDASSGKAWQGVVNIKDATAVSEVSPYKQKMREEDIILEGGSGCFDPETYEGPIFPNEVYARFSVVSSLRDFGEMIVLSYGSVPPPVSSISDITDPVFGVVKRQTNYSLSFQDIFHSRQTPFYTFRKEYEYDRVTESLILARSEEEFLRYAYLDARFQNPRLDSMSAVAGLLFNFTAEGLEEQNYEALLTPYNWCRLIRQGKMEWTWIPLLQDFQQVYNPDAEWIMEWRFYDRYGRLTFTSRRVFSDVFTPAFIPEDGRDWIAHQLRFSSDPEFFRYSDLTYNGTTSLSGTRIPKMIGSYDNFWSDYRCQVDAENITYTPMERGMYSIKRSRRFLDNSVSRFRSEVGVETVVSDDVPRFPVVPRENNISIHSHARKAPQQRNKPFKVIEAGNLWDIRDAKKVFNYLKTRAMNAEHRRNYMLAFPFYVSKGTLVRFGEVRGANGEVLIPNRNVLGKIESFSINRSDGAVSTSITATAIGE